MKQKRSIWTLLAILLVASLALAACASPAATTQPPVEEEAPVEEAPVVGDFDCTGVTAGDTVSMLYQWSGEEEAKLTAILQPWMDACGVVVNPESTRDQALLDTRVQAGTPPDVTFWNIPQLTQYKDLLVDMNTLGANAANYAGYWGDIGTIDGRWLGLPVKADVKTLIWYSPANFEAAGYTVPTTWAELDALVEKMVADGNVPWSLGMESGDATGWTGTDFIQDILLVTQGPDYVSKIISGEIPYNDAGVKEAYEIYGKWAMDPKYTVAGAEGTLSTGFNDAILKVFSDTPEAYMVKQSGFASGTLLGTYPDKVYGVDYDFFGVPGAQGLQGGSDWLMVFNDTPAVRSLIKYLSSDKGGEMWAQIGFDLSPNAKGNQSYTSEETAKKAALLANATGFTPDIGDSIPGGFGSAEFSGITDFVNGGDLDAILQTIADAQADALAQ
ncbi:MAG: ABC transporter substrate-binding protein [Anaerolineaceae bacterium]|nr:ABC transporter substrate-binding protein [Anaerolineaceae bacterium]MDD4042515.1 ABC transporter substrate-binding protein [Anaerolineaceae bacterium]MDD4578507.1 ABC transporter substrate-binding protein [Anaerolineaceae bacterium]